MTTIQVLIIMFVCISLSKQQYMYPFGPFGGYGMTGMSYPYGGYGAYDPYALMSYAGYSPYSPYMGYDGPGMMPGYGGMGLPFMNFGNTVGGYGSPDLSYGKALVTGKRYSSGSGSTARQQPSGVDPLMGNCFGRPGCIVRNS